MKKSIAICLTILICFVFITGCGNKNRSKTDLAIEEINNTFNQYFKTTQYDYQFSEEFDTADLHYVIYTSYDGQENEEVKISFIFKKDKTELVGIKVECDAALSQVANITAYGLGNTDILNLTADELQKYYISYINPQSEIGNFKTICQHDDSYYMVIYQKDYLNPNLL